MEEELNEKLANWLSYYDDGRDEDGWRISFDMVPRVDEPSSPNLFSRVALFNRVGVMYRLFFTDVSDDSLDLHLMMLKSFIQGWYECNYFCSDEDK